MSEHQTRFRFTLLQVLSGMFWLFAALATFWFCYLRPPDEYDFETPLWSLPLGLVLGQKSAPPSEQ
jgi:hypothetical protein